MPRGLRTVSAACAYFVLVFGAGFLLGAVRVPFLVPRLGVRAAELVEMPLMAIVIVWSARFVVRRFALAPTVGVRLGTGVTALVLVLLAEFSFACLLAGQSPTAYVASRDPVSGTVYLALLGMFAVMPFALAVMPFALVVGHSIAQDGGCTLMAVKVAHTVVWAFFVACIVAIPIASWCGEHAAAAWLAAVVLVEVAILVLNRMRCPLTAVAARYTLDRKANFDIFIPEWLARHNMAVFGTLYVVGVAIALARWTYASR